MNTISTNKEKDPLLIRFVNLDANDEEAVISFLRSTEISDLFLITADGDRF